MVDTQTRQSSNRLSLHQILQTDGALSTVFTEHVRCKNTKQSTKQSTVFQVAEKQNKAKGHSHRRRSYDVMILTVVR